jgi:hypothetical protein
MFAFLYALGAYHNSKPLLRLHTKIAAVMLKRTHIVVYAHFLFPEYYHQRLVGAQYYTFQTLGSEYNFHAAEYLNLELLHY